MDMNFKSNPFILIWIGSRLDFEKSSPWPPLLKKNIRRSSSYKPKGQKKKKKYPECDLAETQNQSIYWTMINTNKSSTIPF